MARVTRSNPPASPIQTTLPVRKRQRTSSAIVTTNVSPSSLSSVAAATATPHSAAAVSTSNSDNDLEESPDPLSQLDKGKSRALPEPEHISPPLSPESGIKLLVYFDRVTPTIHTLI